MNPVVRRYRTTDTDNKPVGTGLLKLAPSAPGVGSRKEITLSSTLSVIAFRDANYLFESFSFR
jgi:hypothetical protein